MNPKNFLPPKLQNLFELSYWSEGNTWLPSGQQNLGEDKELPKLSSRIPPETVSSEDQFDNTTNGTASNEESSSDDAASRLSIDMPQTRMAEESEDEDNFAVKVSQLQWENGQRCLKGSTLLENYSTNLIYSLNPYPTDTKPNLGLVLR